VGAPQNLPDPQKDPRSTGLKPPPGTQPWHWLVREIFHSPHTASILMAAASVLTVIFGLVLQLPYIVGGAIAAPFVVRVVNRRRSCR
jgi:hypothetical protein